jgi:hypothetical protein
MEEGRGKPEYPAAFVSDGHLLLTLWQCKSELSTVGFDRNANVGLQLMAWRAVRSSPLLSIVTVSGAPLRSMAFSK